MIQIGGFLGRLFKPLLKSGLPFIGNVLKSVFLSRGLTAAMPTTDTVIQKKIFGSRTTAIKFSIEDLNDIMKIVKSVENVGLLIKGVSETDENEVKEQKEELPDILAATLCASLLGNMLANKGVIRADEGTKRAGQDF